VKANFYVYEHWRMDRDECFYVGKGHGTRAYDMRRGRNRHHKAIVAKMSHIGSSVEVRIVADGLIEEESFQIEKERIKFWRNAGADLANLTDGGEGPSGRVESEELKRQKSKKLRGRKMLPEQVEKSRRTRLGMPKSLEMRAKISAGKKNPSAETRAKLSFAAKNRSAETLAKLSFAAQNMSQERKDKIAATMRKVNSSLTPEQRAKKAEIGRISSKKYWDSLKIGRES